MSLEKVLAISGKPGLYKLVTQTRGGFIAESLLDKKTKIHPNGSLEIKPWGQKEFSVLDPDNNLLTFGESL